MAIVYRIYFNGGTGGPVNRTTPVATPSGLTWDSFPLASPSDNTFAIEVLDTVTGLQSQTGDAWVRVRIGDQGADVTLWPAAPVGLSVAPRAGGTAVVAWTAPPGGAGGAPRGFHVYLGTPTPDYSTPAAVVAYDSGSPGRHYQVTLTGLSDGVVYAVAVRAWNAGGEEQNTTSVLVTGDTTGPAGVVPIAAVAIA
jgi:hypothetical protein